MTSETEQRAGLGKDSVTALLAVLRDKFQPDRLAAEMRVLSRGLFIDELFLQSFTEVYQDWHHRQTGSSVFRNLEKCRKHLFGAPEPEIYYLIEGKLCLVGYFVPAEITNPASLHLPVFQGSLTTAKDSLHPRDPLLQNTPGLSARLDPQKGLQLSLSARGREYGLNTEFLSLFASTIRNSRRLSQDFPEAARGLRHVFPALCRILSIVRAGRGRRKILIPSLYRNNPERILLYKRLCLILNEQHELSHCYELRAENLEQFVAREADILRRNRHATRIGPFSLALKDGPSVGFIRIRGTSYKMSKAAFQQYLSHLLRMRIPPRELPAAYTLYDTLSLLARITQKGSWVPSRDIPKALFEQLEGHELVLQGPDWRFIISGDTVQRIDLRPGAGNEPTESRSRGRKRYFRGRR